MVLVFFMSPHQRFSFGDAELDWTVSERAIEELVRYRIISGVTANGV